MELAEAIEKANRILYEERVRPTVRYYDRVMEWMGANKGETAPPEIADLLTRWSELYRNPRLNLEADRKLRPRHVHVFPGEYVFRSENFDLLSVIFSQLSAPDRMLFVGEVVKRVTGKHAQRELERDEGFPCFCGCASELPLLAEFVIRKGSLKPLVDAVNSVQEPTVGLAIMFIELEEMIALNFTIFSDAELGKIVGSFRPIWDLCARIDRDVRREFGSQGVAKERRELWLVAREVCGSINGIMEECRTARHYYLREQLLQEKPNLEIEGDRTRVIDYLDSLGFDPVLARSLKKAEELYRSSSDGFDLKSCIGHIRSFIEKLHIDAASAVAATMCLQISDEWDPVTTFLKNNGLLTPQQEKFARGLFTLSSDEGVHPLVAEREFSRLVRNMAIEYGLMFLTALDKRGIKIT